MLLSSAFEAPLAASASAATALMPRSRSGANTAASSIVASPRRQLRLITLIDRRIQILAQVVGNGRHQGKERVSDPCVNRDKPAPVRPEHRVSFADDLCARKGTPCGHAHQAGNTDAGGYHQPGHYRRRADTAPQYRRRMPPADAALGLFRTSAGQVLLAAVVIPAMS
jgi:hypothetical protein